MKKISSRYNIPIEELQDLYDNDVEKINPIILDNNRIEINKNAENRKITDISDFFSKNSMISNIFYKCINGYHTINSSPINETIWEDINQNIFYHMNIDIYFKSNGSHISGMDIDSSIGKISNKSAKISKNKHLINMSSYRLTNICNNRNNGNKDEIISEISKRKNFDYYSLIVRDENFTNGEINEIEYTWLLIPSNYYIFNPENYIWNPSFGKRGRNKNYQTGWSTNEINGCKLTITFSMSSQLWFHIKLNEDLKKFIVSKTRIKNNQKYNYIDIFNKLK